MISNNMLGDFSVPVLQALIGEVVETKARSVKGRSLFSVSYPESDMV